MLKQYVLTKTETNEATMNMLANKQCLKSMQWEIKF